MAVFGNRMPLRPNSERSADRQHVIRRDWPLPHLPVQRPPASMLRCVNPFGFQTIIRFPNGEIPHRAAGRFTPFSPNTKQSNHSRPPDNAWHGDCKTTIHE